MSRPPLPPFTLEVRHPESAPGRRRLERPRSTRVALAYSPDSRWRNRSTFLQGRAEIEAFLTQKWQRELDYRLIKELWAFCEDRIAVRFAYEWHDASGQWFRSYGNENWAFDGEGLMHTRIASINDLPIASRAPVPLAGGRRPDDHAGSPSWGCDRGPAPTYASDVAFTDT
jgi:nuclear transport factor 2 (NTF2) superfamily protein